MVRGLGFADDDLDRPLRTFSGGELTRGSLARTLAGDPDLLLLDEPTNHLDVASLEWLEEQLTGTDAAIVLVAHDRWFLEAVGTAVLELEAGRSRFFAGPWHAWRKEQAARELALGRAIERQQAEIERLERFVTRFRAGTRSRQAQARVKKLAKMERLERDPRALARRPASRSSQASRSGRVALELEGATIAGGRARRCSSDAELWLERGEHVTLVGPNGAGKTTLIETLAGRRPLAEGKLRRGHNVELGFLSQHAEEIGRRGTALEAAQRATGLTPEQGPRAARPVPVLGRRRGEGGGGALRRRAAAAVAGDPGRLGREPADPRRAHQPPRPREPRGAGGRAARLRRRAAARLPRPRPAGRRRHAHDRARGRAAALLRGRLGGLRARARRAPRRRRRRTAAGTPGRRNGRRRAGQAAGPAVSKNTKRRIAALERAVERGGGGAGRVEDELADPGCWSTPERSAESTERHHAAKRAVERLYEELSALE